MAGQSGMVGRRYLERGRPVTVLKRASWTAGGPRNVLIRRESGELVVRQFRGLRRCCARQGCLSQAARGDQLCETCKPKENADG